MKIKNVKSLKWLSNRIAIYVPHTVNGSEQADNTAIAEGIALEFAKMFGGVSLEAKGGLWKMETGEIVRERITVVYSNCTDKQLKDNFKTVISMAERLRKDLGQEAITVEFNNQITFI